MSDLPEPDPISADRRRVRKRAKLPSDAACLICGIGNPDMLETVTVPGLLELHHVLGQVGDPDLVVVLCKNHHAVQTAGQHDLQALPPLGKGASPDSVLERLARALRSLAVFLHGLAHSLTRIAHQVLAFVAELDAQAPGWRLWHVAR